MSQSIAAQRYASALFQVAKQHGEADSVEQDLREVKTVFTTNKELLELLESPKLSTDQKRTLISELFAGANVYVINTLQLIMERDRLEEVAELVEEYIRLSNDDKGIADAVVFSTRPLSDEERAAISDSFAAKIGKRTLRIENVIDPSLIGGLRVQIGNRIYDSSISAKLERLQRKLIG